MPDDLKTLSVSCGDCNRKIDSPHDREIGWCPCCEAIKPHLVEELDGPPYYRRYEPRRTTTARLTPYPPARGRVTHAGPPPSDDYFHPSNPGPPLRTDVADRTRTQRHGARLCVWIAVTALGAWSLCTLIPARGDACRRIDQAVERLGEDLRRQAANYDQVIALHQAAPWAKATTGWATFYGAGEQLNAHTASGGLFAPELLEAASWDYPLGTILDVRHGQHQVRVRVTDRGPARWTGAVLDLTPAAFARLEALNHGRVLVQIRRAAAPYPHTREGS